MSNVLADVKINVLDVATNVRLLVLTHVIIIVVVVAKLLVRQGVMEVAVRCVLGPVLVVLI